MECEVQPPILDSMCGSARRMCVICGQITGRGIPHGCSPRDQHTARQSRVDRARSLSPPTKNRRKRNLSVLLGKEEERAQEQIISEALGRIEEHKGLMLMKGGGKGGESKEVTMGGKLEDGSTLFIELFQEKKRSQH